MDAARGGKGKEVKGDNLAMRSRRGKWKEINGEGN